MKSFSIIFLSVLLVFSLASCKSALENTKETNNELEKESEYDSGVPATDEAVNENETTSLSSMPDTEDMFTKNDLKSDYEAKDASEINLSGSEDIIISEEGTYILSGSLDGASLVVNSDKNAKIRLILSGVSITNNGAAAIYIKQADKVFITLADGTENSLTSNGEFVQTDENKVDGAIFSKDDLTLSGKGTLKIKCEAGNGIVSKDDLVFTGGKYEITAQNHGAEANDCVKITDTELNITAEGDGIHCENEEDASLGYIFIESGAFKIKSGGDGISASNEMKINGGSFDITAGDRSSVKKNDYSFGGKWGGSGGFGGFGNQSESSETGISMKAFKASGDLTLNDGEFAIDSADDALHSNANVTVNGGTFKILTGDDGVHADLAATIISGKLVIEESYEGIEGETIKILGGEISIVASDDGMNAAGGADSSGMGGFWGGGGRPDAFGGNNNAKIEISGGLIVIDASGDGVDSNGSILVSGGETYIGGPTNSGNGALDFQTDATITGGVFIAAGASGMAENFRNAENQGSVMMSCNNTEKIRILDSEGNEIISYTPTKSCNSIIISCPELKEGESYVYKCGESTTEFTLDSLIYGGGMDGFGGFGGNGGGFGGFGEKPSGERPKK